MTLATCHHFGLRMLVRMDTRQAIPTPDVYQKGAASGGDQAANTIATGAAHMSKTTYTKRPSPFQSAIWFVGERV